MSWNGPVYSSHLPNMANLSCPEVAGLDRFNCGVFVGKLHATAG